MRMKPTVGFAPLTAEGEKASAPQAPPPSANGAGAMDESARAAEMSDARADG